MTRLSPSPAGRPRVSVDLEFLVFESAGQRFALSGAQIIQIIDLPPLTSLPTLPACLRGVMDFRGETVPLFDLRKKLGAISQAQELSELIKTLELRKQDHLQWLAKLKDAVYNQYEITVETNPQRCAFGKWYDSFKTDSTILAYYLSRFDKPHRRIHQVAVESKELMKLGKNTAAQEIIRAAEKKELKLLIKLFDNAAEQIIQYSYEYAVVVEQGAKKMAIIVDALKYFDKFDAITEELPALITRDRNNFIVAIGKKKQAETIEEVMIIQLDKLLGQEMALLSPAAIPADERPVMVAPAANEWPRSCGDLRTSS